jgi:U3 small nucleolar RNA-associated protein 11
MEHLKASLHFLDDSNELDEEDKEEEYDDDDEPSNKKAKSNHIVFVDNDDQAKRFSPAKHLDTLPELVNRKFNRPTTKQLRQANIIAPENNHALKEIKKERERAYKELSSRMKREEQLQKAERELDIQKSLRVSLFFILFLLNLVIDIFVIIIRERAEERKSVLMSMA